MIQNTHTNKHSHSCTKKPPKKNKQTEQLYQFVFEVHLKLLVSSDEACMCGGSYLHHLCACVGDDSLLVSIQHSHLHQRIGLLVLELYQQLSTC